jgi:hypothetical protein
MTWRCLPAGGRQLQRPLPPSIRPDPPRYVEKIHKYGNGIFIERGFEGIIPPQKTPTHGERAGILTVVGTFRCISKPSVHGFFTSWYGYRRQLRPARRSGHQQHKQNTYAWSDSVSTVTRYITRACKQGSRTNIGNKDTSDICGEALPNL